jgi:hypothetical protein
MNILPGNIRDGSAVTKRLAVKDQASFFPLSNTAKDLTSKIQPQFQRHVKTRQFGSCSEADGRDVVDSVSALLNDARDFSEPYFTGVVDFQ